MHGHEAGTRQREVLEARLMAAGPDEVGIVIAASTTTYLHLTRADLMEILAHMDGERNADRLGQQLELEEMYNEPPGVPRFEDDSDRWTN